jgi:diadenosine tetraphosphate (Ap4A) HIT family hydrolase
MGDSFVLHPQLAQDTLFLGDWPLCRMLRMNDRSYPWLILVPRVPDIREIIDLVEDDQQRLVSEIAQASRIFRKHLAPDKLNVAALGNVVPQLHVHIVARFVTDPAWPRPIWGVKPVEPFPGDEAMTAVAELRAQLGLPQ